MRDGSCCKELDSCTAICADLRGLSTTILNGISAKPTPRHSAFSAKMVDATDPATLEFEPASPFNFCPGHACVASKSDPDALACHEAMRDPDKNKFIEAMQVEIEALEKRETWILVTCSEALLMLPNCQRCSTCVES